MAFSSPYLQKLGHLEALKAGAKKQGLEANLVNLSDHVLLADQGVRFGDPHPDGSNVTVVCLPRPSDRDRYWYRFQDEHGLTCGDGGWITPVTDLDDALEMVAARLAPGPAVCTLACASPSDGNHQASASTGAARPPIPSEPRSDAAAGCGGCHLAAAPTDLPATSTSTRPPRR